MSFSGTGTYKGGMTVAYCEHEGETGFRARMLSVSNGVKLVSDLRFRSRRVRLWNALKDWFRGWFYTPKGFVIGIAVFTALFLMYGIRIR